MLRCTLNDKGLQIKFDIPVPATSCDNKEFSKFLKKVTAIAPDALEYDDKKRLFGMTIAADQLDDLTDTLLPTEEAELQKSFFTNILKTKKAGSKDGLEINFHQNPFDTPERYWNFIFNQGHFNAYFFNRINWFLGPKNEYITDFPLHVDLESASTCNMNCPMCYRNELKHTGQMDFDLFKKAVDECAKNNVFSIRLSWRGETLTHPQIKEFIVYATSRIKNVSFLTNAFYLDRKMIDSFIDSKVSYVAVSFDGIDDIYEKIRHPAKFMDNYQNLALLKQRKKEMNSFLPQVRLCTIWPAIKNNPDAYYEKMSRVSDYIVCNPYINFKGPMEIKQDFICQYPWERIVIGYNGDTQCCTGWEADDIILGNVAEHSIRDMWHSRKMQAIRTTHSKGGRMELKSCARCRHGAKGDSDIDIDTILERHH